MKKDLVVSCPTCKKSVAWNDSFPFRPFCSERCKLIDLGEWADESHKIPGEPVINPDLIQNSDKQDY
jgi:hypothetical protein